MGKKIIMAISHTMIPKINVPDFFMSAAFEIFSKHLDQEVGYDVGQNDCENTAGRSGADIKSLDTQRVDQESQVFAGMPGTAGSGGVDLGKNREQEDRLDHHHDSDGALQMWNHDMEKHLNRVCPIDGRRFLLFGIERLERSEENQKSKREPLPGDDNNNGKQRIVGKPGDGPEPKLLQNEGDESVIGMQDEIFPDQGAHRRHDEEGGDHQQGRHILTEKFPVVENGQENPEDDRDDQDRPHQNDRIDDGRPEVFVLAQILVVFQSGKAADIRIQKAVPDKGKVNRQRQWNDHPQKQGTHRREL